MLNAIPGPIRVILFVLLLATCGAQIVRNAVAAPVTQPVEKDQAKAAREAISRVGGTDVKAPLAETSAGVVGGNGLSNQRSERLAWRQQCDLLIVHAVLAHEGQQVKAGDLLVQLDNAVELASLQGAEADLSAERANLARTLKGLRLEDREAVQSEAMAAKARAELSSGVLSRTEQLAKSGAATPAGVLCARRTAQTDQATYKGTEARLRAAEAGSRAEDVGFQRARVLAAEARVAQAKASVDTRLAIRAPFDAEVLQIKVRPGELYSFQGTEPLAVLGDTTKLRVRMDVDERDIAKIATGASAYVTADAFLGQKFVGKVVELGRRFGRKNIRTH